MVIFAVTPYMVIYGNICWPDTGTGQTDPWMALAGGFGPGDGRLVDYCVRRLDPLRMRACIVLSFMLIYKGLYKNIFI